MPKLSKFRVVNLIYNDTRHIYDEVFDFSQGNDAMMLLANGGGKTVLTQMMLQPVIPKTDLKTRKFTDYFKNNTQPTLLMSEWVLDSEAGTLLTGLLIKHQIRKKRGQDEDRETLNIHTFVIHYQHHDTYNIDNIPVINRDAYGRKRMRSYDEILFDLEKQQRHHKGFVSVYNWSDSSEAKRSYQSKLGEYGIIQQEWQDNILKINKEEAGLKSFFEDSKTSNTLVKRKILPNIESKLEESNVESVEIQSLVRSYATELIKNDKIIKNESVYKSFLAEGLHFQGCVESLEQDQKNLETTYMESQRLRNGLHKYAQWAGEQADALELEKKENRRQSNLIKFEEDCYKYYKKVDVYQVMVEEAQVLEKKVIDLKGELRDGQYQRDSMKAAQLYKEIKELKTQIEQKQFELNQVLAKESEIDIEGLMVALNSKYNEHVKNLEEMAKRLASQINEVDAGIDLEKAQIDEKKKEIHVLTGDKSRKGLLVEQFEERVESINQKNNDFKWEKHPMLLTFESQDLSGYLAVLEEEESSLQEQQKANSNKRDALQEQIEVAKASIKEAEIETSSKREKLNVAQNNLITYLKAYEHGCHQVFQYGIENEQFFDTDYGVDLLDELIQKKETAISHKTIERSMMLQGMESLKSGHLYTLQEDVEALLDKHHISFEYGYKWLREYKGQQIPEKLYMEYLRVLPYALIMDERDMATFRTIDKTYHLSSVIPVMSYNYINQVMEMESSNAENDVLYHTAFDQRLLNSEFVQREIRSYEERVDHIEDEISTIRNLIKDLQTVKFEYEKFHGQYTTSSYEQLMELRDAIDNELEKLQKSIESSEQNMAEAEKVLLENRKQSEHLALSLDITTQKLETYKDLETAFTEYCQNLDALRICEKRLAERQDKLISCELHLKEQEELKRLKAKELNAIQTEISNNQIEMSKLKDVDASIQAEENPLYRESLETLKARYDAYNRNHGDAQNIGELIAFLSQNLKGLLEQIMALGIDSDVYENTYYDVHRLKEQNEWVKKTETVLRDTEIEHERSKAIIDEKKKDTAELKQELLDKSPNNELLEKEAITDTRFKVRKEENQSQYKDLDEKRKGFLERREKANYSIKRIDDATDEKAVETHEAVEFGPDIRIEDLNRIVNSMIETLKNAIKTERESKREVSEQYLKLNNQYNGYNDLLSNMFNNLLKGENIYNFQFVKRVYSQTKESITRTLEKYETDLKNMKKSEGTLHEFVLTRVSSVYDQLKDIDKYSTIELRDKRQKMLYIDMPKKETLDGSNLRHYLKEVIRVAKHRIEEGDLSELDRYLDNHLKLEQLFDEYLPIRSIRISVSKIEQNKVSKIPWEEVSKTSGGEMFVSVFILFISLLSYTRGYQLSKKQQGKVLVMDNPFGPISSEHLLEPLFRIAKTYDTQLICFTHINTSAITNQFDLIYSMRVLREAGSTKEHLDVKLTKDSKQGIEMIESTLFEIGDGDQLVWV